MRIAGGRSAIGLIAVAAALALAGCNTTQSVSLANAEGATVIFESLDGPPRPLSARLARSLDQEAAARRLVVVTRGGQALYHIRGYLAAHTEGGMTSFAWAFDVYDAERRRAFRLRGEERAAGAGTGSWAAADEAILQRIASTSIAQLMTFIASDRTASGTTAAGPSQGATLAGRIDDFGPESAAVLRGLAAAPAAAPATDHAGPPLPLPPQRPGAGPRSSAPVLAYSVPTE